ncbi:MAG TPA: aldehyde dehydrogenase family protein, partial [Hyphomonas sp.]|nr:aldehyde dehydrogenase family protein [Hyphomonas sp.]
MALDSAPTTGMAGILARQKAAHIRDGIPSLAKRIEWLDKSIDLLVTYGDELNDAMCQDFGHRSKDQSALTDIGGSIGALKHAKKHVAKWMRPEKRKPEFPLGLLGSKAELQFQPKGVIGVLSPWNFPVNLTFTPLAGIFAAGNRCMIKPSEFTEATSEVMRKAIAQYYSEEEVAVVT